MTAPWESDPHYLERLTRFEQLSQIPVEDRTEAEMREWWALVQWATR